MKPKTVLKTLDDLSPQLIQPEAAKPATAHEAQEPNDEQQLRQALLLVEIEENSESSVYPHWGLNE